ncbi:MAG: hypothetical protein HY299_09870 [Verrucomicrobia bacterium]|nr:hypothetical protein [Verrucomicrobiota bacterium]
MDVDCDGPGRDDGSLPGHSAKGGMNDAHEKLEAVGATLGTAVSWMTGMNQVLQLSISALTLLWWARLLLKWKGKE